MILAAAPFDTYDPSHTLKYPEILTAHYIWANGWFVMGNPSKMDYHPQILGN